MTRADIERTIRELLVAELRCPASKIRDEAELDRDLGASSLDKITVTCGLENRFGIRLSDDECIFAQTVGTLADLVEQKLDNRQCGALSSGSSSETAIPRRAA